MGTLTLPKKVRYPSSDGKPMAETDFHVLALLQTLALLRDYFLNRQDVYVAGNNLVYYVEGDPKKRLSPDTYVVFGVPNRLRKSYKVWKEGKFPDIAIEFTSRSTMSEDIDRKFRIYERKWKLKEYFLFDPTSEFLDQSPIGYRLVNGKFQLIAPAEGRVLSEALGFTLERDGNRLAFRDAKTGEIVRLESERRLLDAEREIERLKQLLAAKNPPSSNGH